MHIKLMSTHVCACRTVSGVLHSAAVSCSIALMRCTPTSVSGSQALSLSRSLMSSAMDLLLELVLCRQLAGVTCMKQARTCGRYTHTHKHACTHVSMCTHVHVYIHI